MRKGRNLTWRFTDACKLLDKRVLAESVRVFVPMTDVQPRYLIGWIRAY